MAGARLAERLRGGETILSSWNAIPEPLVVELVARAGFDVVVLDMQHGHFGPETVMRSIGPAALAGKPAVVRIPVGDFAMASRALDMGAEAVIAPMINSARDAAALVEFTKFPPLGGRSWGPARAMNLQGTSDGPSFLAAANAGTLTIAMIETKAALDALDAILSTPGIDGVLAGPSDLSVSLTEGKTIDAMHPRVDEMLRKIAAAANAAGKFAATVASDAARARAVAAMGYRFIALGTDSSYLTASVTRMIAEYRSQGR